MSQNRSDFLKLLITIFGFFFGGWWTSFLLDIVNSSNISLLNRGLALGNILIIFATFYLVVFLEPWAVAVVILGIFDLFIIISMVFFGSAYPEIADEPFCFKFSIAMISLGILQFLVIRYSKTSKSARVRPNKLTRKQIEEAEDIDEKRKENLKRLSSLVGFKVSNLSHNLKVPSPSVDLQVMVNNNSIFDIRLRKFIYKPTLLGMRGGTLGERTYDHEIEIPYQNSKWFDTEFVIPEGIATYLENCKRQANGGKHGRLTWSLRCTAYFLGPDGEFIVRQNINYFKEWYAIELPRGRAV